MIGEVWTQLVEAGPFVGGLVAVWALWTAYHERKEKEYWRDRFLDTMGLAESARDMLTEAVLEDTA